MTNNYLLEIEYDGTNYFGSQIQKNKPTIQGEITKAIKTTFKQNFELKLASRTDSKVHAKMNFCLLKINVNMENNKLRKLLNNKLNSDINIKKVSKVDQNFHVRYNVEYKEYEYIFTNIFNIYTYNYKTYNQDIFQVDIDKIKKVLKEFIGIYDFSAFTHRTDKENKIREILNFDCEFSEDKFDLIFKIKATGFLRYQIRLMIGTIVLYIQNKITINDIKQMLNEQIKYRIEKARAQGLYLINIKYK